ncbi:MAG: hypothetical protein E5X76_19900 [Mesorhizobium sp.]|nr:MAG: hypothetical protein E5X76_19900 [Mesorhizobium sp.]
MTSFNEIQALQFAWFTGDETPYGNIEAAFKAVTGVDAEQLQRQRPPNTPVPLSNASAVVDSKAQIRLQVSPGRADIFIEPVSTEPSFPFFDSPDVVNEYLQKAKKYCKYSGKVNRQSFIIKIAKRVPSATAFGAEFAKVLGSHFDEAGTSDHVLQINKRVKLGALEINRVLKWATEIGEIHRVSVNGQFSAPGIFTPTVVVASNFVTYLIDVNTVPTDKLVDAGGQIAILDKLSLVVKQCMEFESLGDLK